MSRAIDEPVTLTRIVTRGGDGGMTSLGSGERIRKDDLRLTAVGDVDELNAAIGLAVASLSPSSRYRPWLTRIQNDLFDLGADLSVPLVPQGDRRRLRIEERQVQWLEALCSEVNAELAPLRTFVLPGGCEASARLHLARTVSRRAERHVVSLHRRDGVNGQTIRYLNRLGDLLFVLARAADRDTRSPVRLWRPGATTLERAAELIFPDTTRAAPA